MSASRLQRRADRRLGQLVLVLAAPILPDTIGREVKKRFGNYPFEDHSRVGIRPVTISPAFAPGCSRRSPEKHRSSGGCSSRTSGTSCWLCMAKRIPRATISGICMTPDTSSIAVAGPINCATRLRDIYVALDGAVGELLRAVDGRTTVMLVSGDGMGPNYSGSHLLEDVLIRIGALTTAGAIETAGAREARGARATGSGEHDTQPRSAAFADGGLGFYCCRGR